jgi:hypothetical protein
VTANSRPPVLLATGNEGSRVISWIRRGNYVFELYGDAERRTVLATVTVSGIATDLETSSQGTELCCSAVSMTTRWTNVATVQGLTSPRESRISNKLQEFPMRVSKTLPAGRIQIIGE